MVSTMEKDNSTHALEIQNSNTDISCDSVSYTKKLIVKKRTEIDYLGLINGTDYLYFWVGGIVEHLDYDSVGWPREPTGRSNGELVYLKNNA